MDNDLDDLFGEGPVLHLLDPIPKGLIQRLDELSISGCRQKLGWSHNGCIAYISADGRYLILRHLICDPDNGQWMIGKECILEECMHVHQGAQLVHLSWSYTGSELMLFDIIGRISVWSIPSMAHINRLVPTRQCVVDPEDNLSAVVGMMWLHHERHLMLHKPMRKVDGYWRFSGFRQIYLGSRNPFPKSSAMVAVTRNGTVKVLFQDKQQKWQHFQTPLEEPSSPNGLLTHAAICAERIIPQDPQNKNLEKESPLLLATYNCDRRLSVYRLVVNVSTSRVHIQHYLVTSDCRPIEGSVSPDPSPKHNSLTSQPELGLLEFIPQGSTANPKVTRPASILGAFVNVSDGMQSADTPAMPRTILRRWEIHLDAAKVHSSFGSLSSKKSNASTTDGLLSKSILHQTADVVIPKTLLCIHQINTSTILAFLCGDGSVEYRDSANLDTLSMNQSEFMNLGQIGFSTTRKPSLHATLSPNNCAVMTLGEQNSPSLSLFQIEPNTLEGMMDDAFLEIVNEAFVMHYTLAIMNSSIYSDDILATMQMFMSQLIHGQVQADPFSTFADTEKFHTHFLGEIHRILIFPVDYSPDAQDMPTIQNAVLYRFLSTTAALSFVGKEVQTVLSSTVAQTILNERYVLSALSTVLTKPADNQLKHPETVNFMMGMISWSISLMNYIVDEIITLRDTLEEEDALGDLLTPELLDQKSREASSPALYLLLASTSRVFLRHIAAVLRGPATIAIKDHRNTASLPYLAIESIMSKSPVSPSQFESLLAQVDASVKLAYQSANLTGPSNDERKAIELNIIIKASIPSVLLPAVKDLLNTAIPALKENINVAELYFTDISWLGLTHDESAKRQRREHPVDVMRKTELGKGVRWKRCTRCCNLTEDGKPERTSNVPIWLLQRTCICGSGWMVLEQREGEMGGLGRL